MTGHAVTYEPEWEYSPWPLVISIGILFLAPFAFSLHFVYQQSMLAVISLGMGVPLILIGIIGWISEAINGGHGPPGLSIPAMGWFILAEAMIFVSFFVNYWFMRLSATSWPPDGTVELPTIAPLIMTIILVSSSFTIHVSEAKLEQNDNSGFLKWLLLTIVLGICFLGFSAYEWNHLFHAGFDFTTNSYSTSFFTITGFHGAHVIIGISIFLAILFSALLGKFNLNLVKTGSLYWHFVDIIWFFVVSQLYYW